MTYEEQRQQIKNTALNAIAKIYHPLYKFPYSNSTNDYYYKETYGEQRESYVESIIYHMNKELEALKLKYKKKINEHSHQ